MCNPECRRLAPAPRVALAMRLGALALLALVFAPLPANAGEAWPASVKAQYRLRYNGIDVGHLEMNTNTAGNSYSLSGSAKVSVLFGAITWSGSSTVSGSIEEGAPAPATYAFEWRNNKKRGTVDIGFKDRVAAVVDVKPPQRVRADMVPLRPADKVKVFDPMSAIMVLTKADSRAPCDRRVGVFDGKQHYEIVFTPKRTTKLPSRSGAAPSEIAHVCRITYEPVAGHRDNADTKAYVANRDVEVVLRRIPGSDMLIPYSMTIPSTWGTGSMVAKRIEITTATAGKIAFTD